MYGEMHERYGAFLTTPKQQSLIIIIIFFFKFKRGGILLRGEMAPTIRRCRRWKMRLTKLSFFFLFVCVSWTHHTAPAKMCIQEAECGQTSKILNKDVRRLQQLWHTHQPQWPPAKKEQKKNNNNNTHTQKESAHCKGRVAKPKSCASKK